MKTIISICYVYCMRSALSFPNAYACCFVMYFQLEEIRNIGSLPCLEKLNLSSNPMCIFPDYRTKVLAQFGDRAAEVLNHQCSLNLKPLLS